MKRSRNYEPPFRPICLRTHWFERGLLIVALDVFQTLEPYIHIRYVSPGQEPVQNSNLPEAVHDGDIYEGYVPSNEEQRRESWEAYIRDSLMENFEMSGEEAAAVLKQTADMDIETACRLLETKYHYFGAIYTYEDLAYHQGTAEEINSYIEEQLEAHPFSYYFSRKFADFAGLFLAFFAAVLLAALYYQDTRKNTYELLHTKPVGAAAYTAGKAAGGFGVCLTALAILCLVFWAACLVCTKGTGFEVRLRDFIGAACLYILPNLLMIVCVYGLVSLLFKNPLPAVPLLILYMVYSNMGSRNAEGVYGYYGRPLAIMVRFPGRFFDTAPPPLALLNQSFLIAASAVLLLLTARLWKRRRI